MVFIMLPLEVIHSMLVIAFLAVCAIVGRIMIQKA